MRELQGIALLAPERVVQVLGAALAVHAGCLDVAQRVGRDPDVLPGGRDPQRADALQGLRGRDQRPRLVQVPEAVLASLPDHAGMARVTAYQARDGGGRRRVKSHDTRAYAQWDNGRDDPDAR